MVCFFCFCGCCCELVQADGVWKAGLHAICHHGSHNYFKCVLSAVDVTIMNAIEDVPAVPDTVWAGLLKGVPIPDCLAVADENHEAEDEVAAAAVPPHAIVVIPPIPVPPPRHLEPMSFSFECQTRTGPKQFNINLDGLSHSSGRRRVYAQCPHDNHVACHHYKFLAGFDQEWKAVAHILLYIREGMLAADKREHFRVARPTDAELQDVFDEMPLIVAGGGLDAVD